MSTYMHTHTLTHIHTHSHSLTLGRNFPFCSSVPLRTIWFTHRFECAPYERPTEAEARDTSSITRQWSRYEPSEPPYSAVEDTKRVTGRVTQGRVTQGGVTREGVPRAGEVQGTFSVTKQCSSELAHCAVETREELQRGLHREELHGRRLQGSG